MAECTKGGCWTVDGLRAGVTYHCIRSGNSFRLPTTKGKTKKRRCSLGPRNRPRISAIQASFEGRCAGVTFKSLSGVKLTALSVFGSALVIFSLWQFFGDKRVPRENWDVQTNLNTHKRSETLRQYGFRMCPWMNLSHIARYPRELPDAEPPAEMLACAKKLWNWQERGDIVFVMMEEPGPSSNDGGWVPRQPRR